MVARPTENLLRGGNTQACGPLDQVHRKGKRLCRKMTYLFNQYFCVNNWKNKRADNFLLSLVPKKLIRLTALTLKNTSAKVKIKNEISESLIVNTGVKQGDPLSALLFIVIMDQVLKSLDIGGNISTRLRQVCAYADDILIMARTKEAPADSFIKLNKEAQKAGLVIRE
jgi:hypothetical protein